MIAENSEETAKQVRRRGPGRPFPPGVSGNSGGRPKGSKTFAIKALIAEALSDPGVRKRGDRPVPRDPEGEEDGSTALSLPRG